MSKKFWHILNSNSLYKMGKDFFDIWYWSSFKKEYQSNQNTELDDQQL